MFFAIQTKRKSESRLELCRPSQAFDIRSTQEEEARGGSMFNAVTKMQLMISKARDEDKIEWVFHMVHDFRKAGYLTQDGQHCRHI